VLTIRSPRSRLRIRLVVMMFVLVGVSISRIEPAFGELSYTTEYRVNPIRGTSPEQLWRFMATHPIIDEDGPALANITHDYELTVESEKSGGVCRVADIDFSWRFVITLPKAVDKARMSSATHAMWQEFTGYLTRHEEHHRTIFLDCGETFLAEAAKVTSRRSCFGFKRKIRRFIEKRYKACMKIQRAYDRQERRTVANLRLRRAAGR
jgi:predicted secreted Zn-dependent protease